MRQFFGTLSFPFSPALSSGALAFACLLVAGLGASPTRAQGDDLYGVPAAPGAGETAPSTPSDTATPAPAAPVDTTSAREPAAAAAAPADTAKPAPSRPRVITRETTVNPLDTRRGNYRNPKKALFMSLVVPGLGQAYVGQSAFNYSRAALYFGTEVALGALWYHYTVVKYDRQVKRYRRFADEHWSQAAYEDGAFAGSAAPTFEGVNPNREAYCEAVQRHGRNIAGEEALYQGCRDLLTPGTADTSRNYQSFYTQYNDKDLSAAERNELRAGFADRVDFYRLIGRYQEFVGGWDDVTGLAYGDSSISGSSAHRDTYAAMHRKAQDYSRMQAWFIGGIALNHIASAIDAALTARRNNRRLYEGQARWYDRVDVDGGLAFEGGRPLTRMTAYLSF